MIVFFNKSVVSYCNLLAPTGYVAPINKVL
nr:MAG TPA: hypothetical protein [Caudoviricetes sp.]